ncbi:aldolase [Violaceomyces palustris]|uniref:Aldolase n=1 Tax=Violaceomyces palustris TaxID=1673888 RepID=A0ACD0P233_9BASI|nr:aldolase [Violaceomyces palustris]
MSAAAAARRSYPQKENFVKIIEVSARDGLQNEKGVISPATKVELIKRIVETGIRVLEAGAFVSPKWVPQMATTPEVVTKMKVDPNVAYSVLVPNMRGLESLEKLLQSVPASSPPPTDEIALFAAATESFNRANTNCSTEEALDRVLEICERAKPMGLLLRGYISCAGGCPYEGAVDPKKVGDIAKKLIEAGCYEVSIADTIGAATPQVMEAVLNECTRHADANFYAAHCHDTFGTGLTNVLQMVKMGVRSVDSSLGGLGGCPYSPGATGNIDTESVVYALHREGYETGIDLDKAALVGDWISAEIGKPNGSSAGRAIVAKLKMKERKQEAKL